MIIKKFILLVTFILLLPFMSSCKVDPIKTTNTNNSTAKTTQNSTNTAPASKTSTAANPTQLSSPLPPQKSSSILPAKSPTTDKPLAGLKICIDPGHQLKGNNELEPVKFWSDTPTKIKVSTGTQGISTGIAEYIVNLQISLKLRDKLESLGAEVLMIRTDHNVNISNKERAIIGSNFNANVVLRIHCNGSTNTEIKGIELYTRGSGDGTAEYKQKSEHDYKLANELITYLAKSTGAIARGVSKSDEYTGINWCSVPCIIIENGYMSNAEEDKLLCSDEYQGKIVQGIANWMIESKIL